MKLSVIMPVYNEKQTIEEILKRVLRVKVKKEIIIVDGCSTDGTAEVLKKFSKRSNIKIIFFKDDRGKGSAIREGLKHVTGDAVIIQDADLEYDPEDYHKLLRPFRKGKSRVVYGSRFSWKKFTYVYTLNLFGTKLLSAVTNMLYGSSITDEPTCYKLFSTEIIKSIPLTCDGFEFCPEITAKVLKKGYVIIEVPISYYPRTKEEGKKISWKDGAIALWTLFKYRFAR